MPKLVAIAVKGEREVYYLPFPDNVVPAQSANKPLPYGPSETPEMVGPLAITRKLYESLVSSGDLTSFPRAISSASATEKKKLHILRESAARISGSKVIEMLIILPQEAEP